LGDHFKKVLVPFFHSRCCKGEFIH
jgi:hypothetical protein